MNMFVGTIAIVVLLVLYAFMRRPKTENYARPAERRKNPVKPDTKFHAVSLRFPASACEAAKAFDGRRLLSSAAPRIPLPDCDAPECRCRFVHHKDRRSGDDRRDPYGQGFGGASTGQFEEEQRKSGERREDPPDDMI